MVVIRILAWHPEQAYGSYGLEAIVPRLRMYTDIKQKRDLELLAKQILARTCHEIPLATAKDVYDALSMRSLLEGLGAETTVEEV